MRSKRAILLVVLGAVCAVVAVVAVNKRLKPQPGGTVVEGVEILLANRDIVFGEPLRSSGDDANVIFVDGWPKHLTPAGAITDEAAFAEQQMVANTSFVKHQVVLQPQILSEDEFIPKGMYLKKIAVDSDDIKTGRFRAGMKVDLLWLRGREFVDFMDCVQIYAIGRLDEKGRPLKEEKPAPNVYLLVKDEHERAFVNTKEDDFRLSRPRESGCEGPILAILPEEVRKKEAQWLLDRGRELIEEGEHERAVALLREVTLAYRELAKIGSQAKQEITRCAKAMAEGLLEQARRAAEGGVDYPRALSILDDVEGRPECRDDEGIMQQVNDLRQSIQKEMEQAQYGELLKVIGEALVQGNLPAAENLLLDLAGFGDRAFEPAAGSPAPAAALSNYQKLLKDARADFHLDEQILKAHLQQGKQAEARAKLEDMKKKFPAHPGIAELEALVSAA